MAGDLVPRPGHLPQVEALGALAHEPLEGRLARVGRAPVIAERLHVGLPHRPPVGRSGAADLQARRQRWRRSQVIEVGPDQQREMSLGREAGRGQGRPRPRLAVGAPRREPAGPLGRQARRELPATSEGPVEQAFADDARVRAGPAGQRDLHLEGAAGVVAPFDVDVRHRLADALDQHEVGPRVTVRPVSQGHQDVRDPVAGRFAGRREARVRGLDDGRCGRLEVGREVRQQAIAGEEVRQRWRRVRHLSRPA